MNHFETLAKFVTPIAALITVAIGAFTWWNSRNTQFYQNSKAELDILLAAADKVVEDKPYRKFLDDIRKEKLASLAFRRPVRPGEVGALMHYYDRGFATTGDIRAAWAHRRMDGDSLSFRLSRLDRIGVKAVGVYMLVCLILGLFLFVATFLPSPKHPHWLLLLYSAAYALFAWLSRFITNGLFTAQRLSEREKECRVKD